MLIYKKIIDVMRDISAIEKDRKNTAQGYAFRGIDDLYNELHAILAKHGVFSVSDVLSETSDDKKSSKGTLMIYRTLKMKFTFYCEDGSFVSTTVVGEGMDSGDKASNKAMSVAHKYALIQIFTIPTKEAKDPEVDSPEVVMLPSLKDMLDKVYDPRLDQRGVLNDLAEKFSMPDVAKDKLREHIKAGMTHLELILQVYNWFKKSKAQTEPTYHPEEFS